MSYNAVLIDLELDLLSDGDYAAQIGDLRAAYTVGQALAMADELEVAKQG